MRCVHCGVEESGTKVVDSRELEGAVRRRRECINCGQRFTTYERAERAVLAVVKKDGRREEFSHDKLAHGIRRACYKRAIPAEAIDAIVGDIEAELHGMGQPEVPSQLIGERVMSALREVDEVAYVRFASVYREFRDVDTIVDEIEGLRKWKLRLVESRNQLRFRFEEEQTCWS